MGIVRAEKNFKDYSIYISGFMDEEMKAMKVDVPWPRAHKGSRGPVPFLLSLVLLKSLPAVLQISSGIRITKDSC